MTKGSRAGALGLRLLLREALSVAVEAIGFDKSRIYPTLNRRIHGVAHSTTNTQSQLNSTPIRWKVTLPVSAQSP